MERELVCRVHIVEQKKTHSLSELKEEVTRGVQPTLTSLATLIYICWPVKLLFNRCVSGALLMWVKTDLMVIFIGHDIHDGLSAGAITQGIIIIIHKEL